MVDRKQGKCRRRPEAEKALPKSSGSWVASCKSQGLYPMVSSSKSHTLGTASLFYGIVEKDVLHCKEYVMLMSRPSKTANHVYYSLLPLHSVLPAIS